MGKKSGICGGIGSSQHLCNKNFYSNGVQGGILPVAAGMAIVKKMQKKNAIGVVFIGDGTFGEGIVYETFNLCSLLEIPLLIVCENNGYAQSTAQKDFLAGSILSRVEAFGIKTYHSNTWELEDLFSEADKSINYVRKYCKTAFHLVDTYRLNPHSKNDDNRSQDELDKYKKKDPLNIFMKDNPSAYKDMLLLVNNLLIK